VSRWFERYYGPDIFVGRPKQAQQTFETKLGVPVGQQMRMTTQGDAFDVAHLQVNGDSSLAASCIQLMGVRAQADDEPYSDLGRDLRNLMLAYIGGQRLDRPIVTHAHCLSTPAEEDIATIVDMLRSRGVPHLSRMKNVYIGLVQEENGRIHYDPAADAGTYLEFAPSVQTGFPGFVLPPILPPEPEIAVLEPGTLVRPVSRTQIVRSAERIIDRYRWILDWPEDRDLEYVEGDGERSIIFRPNNALSAVWELIEPTRSDSRAGRMLERFDEGPWAIRLGVFGLDAKLEDLDRRGTRGREIAPAPTGARRVELNRYDLHGVAFELEDLPVVHRGVGHGRTT
jgi:hypothetical protein